MDKLTEIWHNLGPLGPCILLFVIGCGLVLKALFFSRSRENYSVSRTLKVATFIGGIALIVAGILFYIYRDSMHWQ